jgi:hypothetical protein
VGDERLTSPITRVPCFYYWVTVERWMGAGRNPWRKYLDHVKHVKFCLQDETGKVLIDPGQAEVDLPESFRAETGRGASERAESEVELIAYLERANVQTHAEMPAPRMSAPRSILKGRTYYPYSFSDLRQEPSSRDTGRRLRFTERCLLPDHEYVILGSGAENPGAGDPFTRKLIARGENEPTFLISSRPELAAERRYLAASVMMILVGGAMLVVAAMLFGSA